MDDTFSPKDEMILNATETNLGGEMTIAQVAQIFSESVPPPNPTNKEEGDGTFSDIYRIAARVKNLARANGATLTRQGDMLANAYVHVLKALYDFAETIPEPHKKKLTDLLQFHEKMPADVIDATKVGK